jgi:hypothetical protein
MRSHQRLQVLVLRLAGTLEMLAFGAVIMPRSWMEAGHEAVGLGTMPSGPLLEFMIRQASDVYGWGGVMLWFMSTNIPRYRPMLILTSLSFLLAGPVFAWIDISVGMPLFWILFDGIGCFSLGAALLWLNRLTND